MTEKLLLKAQQSEITEYYIYLNLASMSKGKNKQILTQIAKDELKHHGLLKKVSGKELEPDKFKIKFYTLLSKIFGLIFVLKIMENGEDSAIETYSKLKSKYPFLSKVIKDEERHELELINLLSDDKVKYASSIVLGLNDALVELSGSIVGFSFVIEKLKLVGISGLVLGIAASLSMTASSYLSAKEEKEADPKKAAIYTGLAYILTVLILVSPYLLLPSNISVYIPMLIMLTLTLVVIAVYSYYMSIVKDEKFLPKFMEMSTLSLGVAFISFLAGVFLRTFIGV